MLRVPLVANYRTVIDKALDYFPSSSVLIIENIKRDKETQKYWSELYQIRAQVLALIYIIVGYCF